MDRAGLRLQVDEGLARVFLREKPAGGQTHLLFDFLAVPIENAGPFSGTRENVPVRAAPATLSPVNSLKGKAL